MSPRKSPPPGPPDEQIAALEAERQGLRGARRQALDAGDAAAALQTRSRTNEVDDLLRAARLQAHLDARAALDAEEAALAAEEPPLVAARQAAHDAMWAAIESEEARHQAVRDATDAQRLALQQADKALEPIRDRRHVIAEERAAQEAAIARLIGPD